MLFLFNDVVFDVGDPREAALAARTPLDPAVLKSFNVAKTIKLVRETIFEFPEIARERADKALFLSAMVAWKTGEANAMLAVRPTAARSPRDVQIRLADVSIVTLAQLRELQGGGRLTARAANDAVWDHAPQRLRA